VLGLRPRGVQGRSDPSRGRISLVTALRSCKRSTTEAPSRCRCGGSEARLEHERVLDHWVVLRVVILLDVEVLLNRSVRPERKVHWAPTEARNSWRVWLVVGGDRGYPGACGRAGRSRERVLGARCQSAWLDSFDRDRDGCRRRWQLPPGAPPPCTRRTSRASSRRAAGALLVLAAGGLGKA
jgi:hypothetical protein